MSCLPGGISGFVGSRLAITQRRHAVKATHRAWPIQPVHLASTVYASGVDRWIAAVYVLTQGWALITAGSMMRKMDARQLAVPNTAENLPPTQYHISGARKKVPHNQVAGQLSGTLHAKSTPQVRLCSSGSQVCSWDAHPAQRSQAIQAVGKSHHATSQIKDAVSNSSCYEPASSAYAATHSFPAAVLCSTLYCVLVSTSDPHDPSTSAHLL